MGDRAEAGEFWLFQCVVIEMVTKLLESSKHEQELIERVRLGDEDAATEFYDLYAARVTGLVRGRIGHRLKYSVDAEDIVQSVFKSMFRGVRQKGYRAEEGETLWRLLAVLAINKIRRRASRTMEARFSSMERTTLDAVDDAVTDVRLESSDIEHAIMEAIECLDEREQELVVLRIRGYTIEEISQQVGRSQRTTERMLRAIKYRLRDQFESDGPS